MASGGYDDKWARAARPGRKVDEDRWEYDVRIYGDRLEFEDCISRLTKRGLGQGPNSRLREDLSKLRQSFIGTYERMFMFESVDWSSLAHKLANDDKLPFSRDFFEPPFKLALLESGLSWNRAGSEECLLMKGSPVMTLDREMGAFLPRPGHALDRWAKLYLKQVRAAVDAGSNVICAGEFGLPPAEALGKTIPDLVSEIRGILSSARQPVFMIAGTRHAASSWSDGDRKLFYNENVASIFSADPRVTSSDPLGEARYFKRSPAMRVGERLFTQNAEDLPIYNTPIGHFGVLICSDAFDARILLSYLRDNPMRAGRAQVIFVPSYNLSRRLKRSCRYLSYLANCVVVYVNSADHDFNHECTRFYVAGLERREVGTFVRKHKDIFDPEYQSDAELANWISGESSEIVSVDFQENGKKKTLSCGIQYVTIDTILSQRVADGAARVAGALMQTARSSGRKYSL